MKIAKHSTHPPTKRYQAIEIKYFSNGEIILLDKRN